MRIAVLGAGAMGRLFAAKLSKANDVVLLVRSRERAEAARASGITVHEQDGSAFTAHPEVAVSGEAAGAVELILVFVKSMDTQSALSACRGMIGERTCILTLQNGGGHEETLSQFVPMERVLIGTTQHNASIRPDGSVFHGGSGHTVIGSPLGESDAAQKVAQAFAEADFDVEASANVREAVWRKLLTNASLSALTGVFRSPMGFVTDSESAWALCERLIREAVAVAQADGVRFDAEEKIAEVRAVSVNGPKGITSICADLTHGRLTEADTITGSVVRAARRLGVSAPSHEMTLLLIHAMEDRNRLLGL